MSTNIRIDADLGGIRKRLLEQQQAQRAAYLEKERQRKLEERLRDSATPQDQADARLRQEVNDARREIRRDELSAFRFNQGTDICSLNYVRLSDGGKIVPIGSVPRNQNCPVNYRLIIPDYEIWKRNFEGAECTKQSDVAGSTSDWLYGGQLKYFTINVISYYYADGGGFQLTANPADVCGPALVRAEISWNDRPPGSVLPPSIQFISINMFSLGGAGGPSNTDGLVYPTPFIEFEPYEDILFPANECSPRVCIFEVPT